MAERRLKRTLKPVLKRTSLYASASSPVNLIQAGFYEEDCIVYDLEDSVSLLEKDAARFLIYHAVRYHRPADKYVVIRVNGIYSEFIDEDLEAAVRARPDAIRIPKVENAREVQAVAEKITEIEMQAGIEPGTIKLWCNIESYLGVLNAREIAGADTRVEAMALGAEDFTAGMGAVRTKSGMEIFYARNAVLLACREAGIDALDAVFSDINDSEGLKEDTILARNMGFDGKTVIHPRQLETVNACFAPSEKEVRYALRILEALKEGRKQGKGVITLDGSMVDKPMELRAEQTIAKAKAAGVYAGRTGDEGKDADRLDNTGKNANRFGAEKKNAAGRELPERIGDYVVKPYMGSSAKAAESNGTESNDPEHNIPVVTRRCQGNIRPGGTKLKPDLKTAITAGGLKDGMTISFHHSFREGDMLIGQVLTAIRELGIKNLKFAPSAVVNIKNPSIVDFVKDGIITSIEASGIRGDLGDAVLEGMMEQPVILRTHGARPRAIEAGDLTIDMAFIGASAADDYGNATGLIGPNACGALGYSFIDAMNARWVVAVTDNLVEYPCIPITISQEYVDFVVVVDTIGDTEKIGAGAARITKNPRDLLIAKRAAEVIASSRRFKNGFVFQTGAGAVSIACTNFLAEKMEEMGVTAAMALGGIPAAIVEMYKKGLVRVIACSQSFDAVAARAIAEYPGIIEIDNSLYANPARKGCMLNRETFGVLGGLEVDTDFNVNILTGSNGEMMGGLGGGPDVADGAEISIAVLPIVRGRIPSVVKKVFTCCTPGETVAVVVTEAGIALNPGHKCYGELKEDLEKTNLKIMTIEELQKIAEDLTGVPKPIECTEKIVCIVEYRDGTVIDVIRQIKR